MELGGPRKLKRKAAERDNVENEPLSKKMSVLNLEQNGQKPGLMFSQTLRPPARGIPSPTTTTTPAQSHVGPRPNDTGYGDGGGGAGRGRGGSHDDIMELDDSKHKVYIYNLDDELTSSESEAEAEADKLIFLPDIERHLRANRIPVPRPMPPSSEDREFTDMQLVLYGVPSSLTVSEDRDSVRRAIIETRARAREKQRQQQQHEHQPIARERARVSEVTQSRQQQQQHDTTPNAPFSSRANGNLPYPFVSDLVHAPALDSSFFGNGLGSASSASMQDSSRSGITAYDPDAMDMS
jgi:hypothetical protein